MHEICIKTENLSVGYHHRALIRDICLTLRTGSILVLIGPNGAGKSTILKSLARQLEPIGGTIWLNGKDLTVFSSLELAKNIAVMYPGRVATEYMTVQDVVSMGRYPYTRAVGILSEEDRAVIRDSMNGLQVANLAEQDFNCLSDGQRQRVLLARALCQKPKLLILDEPTTFLDIHCQLDLLSVLQRLAHEQGLTVILSLHELELARRIADIVVFVKGDHIGKIGPPEEVLTPEAVDTLFDLQPGTYSAYLKRNEPDVKKPAFDHYMISDGKKLRCGFTTGTCAALAARACAERLMAGRWPECVTLMTPKGWKVTVSPMDCSVEGNTAKCAVRKDAGDDADRTDGCLIYAEVTLKEQEGIRISGGEGIGRVTKPGLDQPVGEAAINSVPRKMIFDTVKEAFWAADYAGGADVVVSAPQGLEIAQHTFNPRLGIEGGISILGTSGIVEPMSIQALVDTIGVELRQAAALGNKTVILTPGNYGMDFLQKNVFYPSGIPIVRCSNFIGEALDLCAAHGFQKVLIVGHIGKLVKLAGGIMNTHSKTADCRTELFSLHAALCGAKTETCRALMNCATSDACIEILKQEQLLFSVMESLLREIEKHLLHRADGHFEAGAVLFSNVYGELGKTDAAKRIIEGWKAGEER